MSLDVGGIGTGGGVRFLGQRRSYWRLLIRGAVLLMFTLGIYRFWLATDVRRFLWSNTEIAGEPLFQNDCQCRDCQRMSGTGHGSYLTFPRTDVKQTGEARPWAIVGDSGNAKTRAFCPACFAEWRATGRVVHEPLLWRSRHWARLEVSVAGYESGQGEDLVELMREMAALPVPVE